MFSKKIFCDTITLLIKHVQMEIYMIKPIIFFILSALMMSGGIFLTLKKSKLLGSALISLSLFFIGSGISILVFSPIRGHLLAFLFHGAGSAVALIYLLIYRIKKGPFTRKSFVRLLIIVGGALVIFVGIPLFIRFPLKKVYVSIAANARPYEHSDGLSRALYVNCFYKDAIPGYEYEKATRIEYYSGITNTNRHAMILLPKNYDKSKSYPVLYLLHGLGGDEKSWIRKKADIIIQNMTYLYGCPEMIVVMPNSELNDIEDTSGMGYLEKCSYYDKTEADLVNYLMPYINEHYSVKTGRENTAIAGNSMGARNTLFTAFSHQDLFGYVGAFSSAGVINTGNDFFPPLIDEFETDEKYGNFHLLMVMVGREDHVCGGISYIIHEKLNEAGIDHIFYDVVGTHQNLVWQNALYNFCNRLFRD